MKTKWMFRAINLIAITLIVVSLFVLLTVVLTAPGQVPQIMGFRVFRVLTESMEPTIPKDAMLLVRQTATEAIVPGDVITFFSLDPSLDGTPVTHRVQRIVQLDGTTYFVTKGDANAVEDLEPVPADRLLGKVVFVSAGLGVLIRFLSNPLVFGALILLPLLAMLLRNLYRSVRLAEKLARQEEEAAVQQALEELRKKQQQSDG